MLSETAKRAKKPHSEAKAKSRDGKARSPIYQKIKDRLRARIDASELAPGELVPSERDLSTELGVSRGQARQALRDLEMEGYIERFPGRGSFVALSERRQLRSTPNVRTVMLAYPVFSRDGSWHARALLGAFAEFIAQHGFRPVFFYIDRNVGAEVQLLDGLEKGELAGLALWPQFRTPEECRAVERVQSLFPCVLVERHQRGRESDFVGTANRVCYDRLTTTLMDRGYHTIAYVARDFVGSVMEDRYAGYCDALLQAGGVVDKRLVGLRCEPSEPSAPHAGSDSTAGILRNMFAKKPHPTAIVCSDDQTAVRVASELGRLGLRVPDDIAMAVIDDAINPDRDASRAWLTAVQNGPEIGRQVAQLLLARIAAPSKIFEQRFVRPRYLFEETCLGRKDKREKDDGDGDGDLLI